MLDTAQATFLEMLEEAANAAELVVTAVEETLAYYNFLEEHWRRIRTNNPLERILREIRRRQSAGRAALTAFIENCEAQWQRGRTGRLSGGDQRAAANRSQFSSKSLVAAVLQYFF